MIHGDGFWTRASDYYLYEDVKGCFHIIPNDVNETFSIGGPGGPGGPGGFGPGMFMAPQILTQADKNGGGKLGREEFTALAEAFSKGVLGDAQTTGEGGRPQESSLKSFAEKRRAYLLNNAEVKKAAP